MRVLIWVSIAAGFLAYSCKEKKDIGNTTPNGLKYRFIEKGDGRKPRLGDIMRMHLVYRDPKGKVLYDSKELGDAFVLQLTPPTFSGGLEEGFALMGEGDSAVFTVSADSVFDKMFRQVMPPSVQKGDFLSFEVRMKQVLRQDEFENEKKLTGTKRKSEEDTKIDLFLLQNNIEAKTVEEGVWFVALRAGKGRKPSPGDSVYVNYTGSFLDGTSFDGTGGTIPPLGYVLGDGGHLEAWEKSISGMSEGGLVRLVLRSDKAYGEAGFGPVPPNTPVSYDIELLKVVPAKRAS